MSHGAVSARAIQDHHSFTTTRPFRGRQACPRPGPECRRKQVIAAGTEADAPYLERPGGELIAYYLFPDCFSGGPPVVVSAHPYADAAVRAVRRRPAGLAGSGPAQGQV